MVSIATLISQQSQAGGGRGEKGVPRASAETQTLGHGTVLRPPYHAPSSLLPFRLPGGPFGGTFQPPGVPNEGYTQGGLIVPRLIRPSPGTHRQLDDKGGANPSAPYPPCRKPAGLPSFPRYRSEDLPILPQGWREPHEAARRGVAGSHSRLATAGTSAGFQLPSAAGAAQWLA